MAKIRIFELAKELGKESKEIIEFLGGEFKSQSGLEQEEADKVRNRFKNKEISEHTEKPAEKPAERPVGKETVNEASAGKKEEKQAAEHAAKPVEAAGKKPERQASAASDKAAEEPKKKKPIFVFRPENSGFAGKSGQNRNNQQRNSGAQNPNRDRKPRNENGDRRQRPGNNGRPQDPRDRRVIKPNVPTTAETYRDFARDEKKAETVPAPEEVKKTGLSVNEVPENRGVMPGENTASADRAGNTAADTPLQNAGTPAEEMKNEDAPVRPVRKNVFREMEEKKRQQELLRQQEAEQRKNQPQQTQDNRNRDRNQTRNNNGVRDNRNRPGGQNTGDRRNPAREGSQSGQARSGRQGGFRPGDAGQNRSGQGGQGGQNRGGFSQRNRTGAGQGAAQPAFGQKNDGRGKKNNNNDRDRRNNDRTGKNQENFKTLNRKNDLHKKQEVKKEEEQIKMIVIPDVITLKDLADKMKMKPADLIKKLFLKGKMVTLNTELSYEEAEEIALEYDILCEMEEQVDVIEELLKEEAEDENLMVKRPPVVCVMGHVDHGKTSLLDAIRSTNVTAREAGGITQHIGAYMVEYNGEKITFLDTPGHEAFTAMRMRGAQATDIAILVVAADDGVMPQTVEAINHAKAAGVDVIVAVNKIDKPAANVDRVKQELTEYELVAEDWGGDTVFVPVSAKTGEGIETLLEMILLVTEVKELKANPDREMRGLVIEAKLDKGRGPVATVLIQKGTLKVGDFVSAGSNYGRVRAMLDADGSNLKSAGPSTPVEILGLNGVPNAGEVCIGHKNEKDARSYADTFVAEEKKLKLQETKQKLTMDSLFEQIQAGEIKELPIIVKADVQGSVEAVRSSLEKLSNEEVAVKVIHSGVGAINESDVTLASASNAIVIGFNVKPDAQAKALSESENVDVKLYRVIYQAIEDVERALKGMQAPVYEERILGHAEVRQTFKASGVGVIAGCYVLDGTIERNSQVRISRGKDQLYEGPLVSLKRFKDDVREAREGYECGMVFDRFSDLQEGDQIEAYKMVEVERT